MLPPVDLTSDLKDLARLAGADALDELLRRGLDWLARLAPYDLATVFELHGGRLVVRLARGPLADERIARHSLELSAFPTVREALETRRAKAFTEHDHSHGDGDPFDGILDLPDGHACMVVPLCAADRCVGVLTLDRTRCETFPQQVVDLVEVYAQILTMAFVNAEQRAILERLREQDLEHVRLLQTEMAGSPGVFEESAAPAMRELALRTRQVARTDTPVLIRGETGTGKERLARAIHEWSPRADRPFVKINCAAIPAGLLESELFGHVKGAFTGANADRAGRFATANGGTLLLDEIGELPLELQAKLLRVLQEGTFEPVGSDRTVKVDVRMLAATHVDLEAAIAEKRFREDLYYRLAVFPLRLPPLRERLEDLPKLCTSLLADLGERTGRTNVAVSPEGLAHLATYPWPGNVRELANVLERGTILSAGNRLEPSCLDLPRRAGGDIAPAMAAPAPAQPTTLDDVQRAHIRSVLAQVGGRIYGKGGAAELLGLKPSTLQSRMKKLGL